MDSRIADRLVFGERALGEVVAAMPAITFDPEKRPDLYAVALHASIVQLCGGCLTLAKTEYTAGIPVLLRSLYEALVDLDNLVTDASYSERMEAANLKQLLKILGDPAAPNPLLEGLQKRQDIPELVRTYSDELRELRSRDRDALHIDKKCEAANRKDEYKSVYALLCLDGHNNIAALADRHITGNDEANLQVAAFGDSNPLGLASRIYYAVGWMLTSAQYVHGAFRTSRIDDIARLQREHASARASVEAAG
jgi:hypothetical protein